MWEAALHLEGKKCAGIPQEGFLQRTRASLGRTVRLVNEILIKVMVARTLSMKLSFWHREA